MPPRGPGLRAPSGEPRRSEGRTSESRAANRTATGSASRRRAVNRRASAEASSSQCASSTMQRTALSSAASPSSERVAAPTRNGSTFPSSTPNATRRARAWGLGMPRQQAGQRPEQPMQGCERERVLRLQPLRREHADPISDGSGDVIAKQGGLPDTRLAVEDEGAGSSGTGTLDDRTQTLAFGLPPDEHDARSTARPRSRPRPFGRGDRGPSGRGLSRPPHPQATGDHAMPHRPHPSRAQPGSAPPHRGALFDDVEELDAVGPWEVLSAWTLSTPRTGGLRCISRDGTPVRAAKGLVLGAHHSFDAMPPLEVLLHPGGPGSRRLLRDPDHLAWVRGQRADVRLMTSVCTGALVYAAAGLLTGRPATTHWESLDLLARSIPPSPCVQERATWTTATSSPVPG